MNCFLINTPEFDVFEHMAFDENLALSLPGGEQQCFLRIYNWGAAETSATFGYAQFYNEVKKDFAARGFKGHAARRPTGGGIVYHEDDLTFSLVFTSQLTRAAQIYEMLHGAVNKQIQMSMAGEVEDKNIYAPSVNGIAGACFSNPVQNDIVDLSGKKILGGAIRRFGNIILYQGSLQRRGARGDGALADKLKTGLSGIWNTAFIPYVCEDGLLARAKEAARARYKTAAWTEKF